MPKDINFTISSATRSEGNTSNKSGKHLTGSAIDLSDDGEGRKFWDWGLTAAGKQWKQKNKVSILYHPNENSTGNHYHVEFN